MATGNGNLRKQRAGSSQRGVVLAVPPVDEFYLVCPIQVFSAANRLAGNTVYSVEVAANGEDLKVQGEGGLLSFLAETNYKSLQENFDSLLLVCGLGSRYSRSCAVCLAEAHCTVVAAAGIGVRWLISFCRSWFAQWEKSDFALEVRRGIGAAISPGKS